MAIPWLWLLSLEWLPMLPPPLALPPPMERPDEDPCLARGAAGLLPEKLLDDVVPWKRFGERGDGL